MKFTSDVAEAGAINAAAIIAPAPYHTSAPTPPPQPQQPESWFDALRNAFDLDLGLDSSAGLQALLPLALPVTLFKGAQLLSRTQPAQRHWLLLSGQVAMGLAERGRMTQQTREVRPGQWIDHTSAWMGDGSYLEDALIEHDGLALSFAHADLLRCGLRHPELLALACGAMATRVRDMLGAELSLIRQSAESRFAAWLLQHAETPTPVGQPALPRVVLRQRKRAIASQLGATPETFSRVLRQLVNRGAVRARGYTIELLDLDQLHGLATAGAARRRT